MNDSSHSSGFDLTIILLRVNHASSLFLSGYPESCMSWSNWSSSTLLSLERSLFSALRSGWEFVKM